MATLVKGDAAFGLELYQAVRAPVGAGDLRLLAVASPFRWPAAPDVPTFAESGLEDFKLGPGTGSPFREAHRSRSSTRCTRRSNGCWRAMM